MRYLIASITLAALALLAMAPVPVQAKDDRKAVKDAWATCEAALKDTKAKVEDTIAAVEKFAPMLDHDAALDLLGYFDQCDNAWSTDKKDNLGRPAAGPRPVEAYKIALAILKAVRGMDKPEEVAKFEPNLSDREKYSLRQRTAMLDAIARNFEDTACAAILLALVKNATMDKDTDMRVLAIYHLIDHPRHPEVLDALLVTLRDKSWRIRDVSILALIECSDTDKDRVTLALIQALAAESGKLRKSLADALNRITGADNGTDSDAWVDWFKAKKREDQGLPAKTGKGDRGTRVKVFETESFSDRYVFVIDTSVSMLKKITDEEKEKLKKSVTSGPGDDKDKRRPLDWSQINCKLDLAREEIIRSIEIMDPERTKFTLVSFSTEAQVWKEELVPTDAKTVKEAADWLRAIKGGNKTNVFAALNAALDLSEKLAGVDVDKRKGKGGKPKDGKVITGKSPDEAIPDTIFLYTDGYSTNGKYAGGDDRTWAGKSNDERVKLYTEIMKYMLDEIEDRNRVSRIQINCVGVGDPQDSSNLGSLARRNRGVYVKIGK